MATRGRFAAGACFPLQAHAPDDPPEKVPCSAGHHSFCKCVSVCESSQRKLFLAYRAGEGNCRASTAQRKHHQQARGNTKHRDGPESRLLTCVANAELEIAGCGKSESTRKTCRSQVQQGVPYLGGTAGEPGLSRR